MATATTPCALRTFYGPAAITELGDAPAPMAFTVGHLLHVLQGSAGGAIGPFPRSLEYDGILPGFFNNPGSPSPGQLMPSPGWTWLRPGNAQGRIYGGCLPTILRLAGTKFWPDYQGRILLLENPMGEKMTDPLPLDVTRADMADLVNLGVFEKICGLVIGRPFGYDEEKKKFKKMMLDQCYGTDFPILMDVDVGHTNPMVTVPLDAMVGLDLERDEWSFFGS